MTRAYGIDLRERALRFVTAGESRHVVAERLGHWKTMTFLAAQ